MRWRNARRSDNVDDRRRSGIGGRGVAVGGGIGGIIIALIAVFVFKVDPSVLLQGPPGGGSVQGPISAEEEQLADFVHVVLGYTEDVWDGLYPTIARAYPGAAKSYEHPKLVLFSGQVNSACGFASAAVGPFYCPGDHQIYIDLAFYDELKRRFKAPGDFAQAYVIAHEVGHHVQKLLGITDEMERARRRVSKEEHNQLSVRLELHADFLAGVWANRAERSFAILERGDVDEGIGAASAVGDDTIQKRSQGHVVPDSFTHGTSAQRIRWFTLGLKSGDPLAHDPFKLRYEDL
jgi:hypothetical protein